MNPEIALAASAREWPDRLHRYLLDHGGGVVAGRLMSAEQVRAGQFQVLLIDDICSFLTPRLVAEVHQSGAEIVGVFDPSDGTDAKRRLLECGISDVIESDASPAEFTEKVRAAALELGPTPTEAVLSGRSYQVGILGSVDGVGATETAVGLALAMAPRVETALVDLDPAWPSIVQRLGLAVHPNIRTALDLVVHGSGPVLEAAHVVDDLAVIGGAVDLGSGSPIAYAEASALLDELGHHFATTVADLGALDRADRALARAMDTLLVVGAGDPVGVARTLRNLERILDTIDRSALLVVVNRVERSRFIEAEIRREIADSYPDLPVVTLPADRRLEAAAWEGDRLRSGRFMRAVGRMASLIAAEVAR